MPSWTAPMLATLSHQHFSADSWIFERKLDGQRCLVFCRGSQSSICSRNRKLQNAYYPEILDAIAGIEVECILDGELVTFARGVTSFSRLQKRMHIANPGKDLCKRYPVVLYVFDLLHLSGHDLTQVPLRERKKLLRQQLTFNQTIRYLPHINCDGESYLKMACNKGWEGVIAKQADSRYHHSRSRQWLKFKCNNGQELVIGGYTDPQGKRNGFGALLVGYWQYQRHGNSLCYAGKVGTGFSNDFLDWFQRRMAHYQRKTSPFTDLTEKISGVHWITPRFVGEFAFTEWTDKGRLRHPRFLGLRKDKPARQVVREQAVPEQG
ncbi:MAG: ATP-dependent DNA ligase [Pseudomonadales bacterium]|nr:ATP-dependent DNA ligase [Pseudomonadales bacterium]